MKKKISIVMILIIIIFTPAILTHAANKTTVHTILDTSEIAGELLQGHPTDNSTSDSFVDTSIILIILIFVVCIWGIILFLSRNRKMALKTQNLSSNQVNSKDQPHKIIKDC